MTLIQKFSKPTVVVAQQSNATPKGIHAIKHSGQESIIQPRNESQQRWEMGSQEIMLKINI